MQVHRLAISGFFAVSVLYFGGQAGAQTPGRLHPLQQATKVIESVQEQGLSSPVLNGSFLIQHRQVINAPTVPNITIQRTDTAELVRITHWYPGSTSVHLAGSSASSAGFVYSAGYALSAAGAATYFVGMSRLDGSSPKFFSTGSYLASYVFGAPDGTIWTVGSRPGKSWRQQYYGAVRQYGQDGTLLFQCRKTAGAGRTLSVSPVAASQIELTSWGSHIFLYDNLVHQLSSINSVTHLMHVWNVDPTNLQLRYITGLAVTSAGVFASMQKLHMSGAAASRYSGGLFRLAISANGTGSWQPVESTISWQTRPGDFLKLMGSDGDQLVYTKMGSQFGLRRTEWANPLPQ